jgi:hypothetical protein
MDLIKVEQMPETGFNRRLMMDPEGELLQA